MKEDGSGGEFVYVYLIHCKNLCKCHNVPRPITIIKEKVKNIHNYTYINFAEVTFSLKENGIHQLGSVMLKYVFQLLLCNQLISYIV
jgi:hypothetical protein